MAETLPPMPAVPQYQSVQPMPMMQMPLYQYKPEDYLGIMVDSMAWQAAMLPQMTQAQIGVMPALNQANIAAQQDWQAAMFPITQAQQAAMFQQQLGQNQQLFGQQLPQQVAAQQAMMQGAFAEQMRQQPISTAQQYGLEQAYAPGYQRMFSSMAGAANPQFMPTYDKLGWQINQGLKAGYDLGPGLSAEIEDSIRGAQTARGNVLGTGPTAQEAFGKGSAAIDLYNQRIGQAQNFLQGRQPTDLWGALQMTRPGGLVNQPYYPNPAQLMPGLGAPSPSSGLLGSMSPAQGFVQNPGYDYGVSAQAFNTGAASATAYNATSADIQSNYNNALINAGQVNNQGMFMQYDKTWDQYMFDQAVENGMFEQQQPSSSGQGMALAGSAIGAVSSVAAAAAAFCWLARKVIPNRWQEWRKYLFTEATDRLRRAYVFGAKRLSQEIGAEETVRLKSVMEGLLA